MFYEILLLLFYTASLTSAYYYDFLVILKLPEFGLNALACTGFSSKFKITFSLP